MAHSQDTPLLPCLPSPNSTNVYILLLKRSRYHPKRQKFPCWVQGNCKQNIIQWKPNPFTGSACVQYLLTSEHIPSSNPNLPAKRLSCLTQQNLWLSRGTFAQTRCSPSFICRVAATWVFLPPGALSAGVHVWISMEGLAPMALQQNSAWSFAQANLTPSQR